MAYKVAIDAGHGSNTAAGFVFGTAGHGRYYGSTASTKEDTGV